MRRVWAIEPILNPRSSNLVRFAQLHEHTSGILTPKYKRRAAFGRSIHVSKSLGLCFKNDFTSQLFVPIVIVSGVSTLSSVPIGDCAG